MKSYIVCCEPTPNPKAHINYDLILNHYPERAQVVENVWIVLSDDSPADIRSQIAISFTGRIAVFKSDRVAAWRNVMCDSQWIKANLA